MPVKASPSSEEREWRTRKERIDPKLDAAGWKRGKSGAAPHRTEEEETDNGPADYALWLDDRVAGIVEAKKLTVGPQNVLTQAERYSRGLRNASTDWNGFRAPFLYSTNGQVTWFQDVRHPLNRSRQVAGFHTPAAFGEMLSRNFEAEVEKLLALPRANTKLRDYQHAANEAVDKAIAARKRALLVAMATGTGKTYTLVNQIYRLMKSGAARRVLFLVDRRALAAQAVRAFASFEAEPGKKFDQLYEVYSSKFQREDLGDEEEGDKKVKFDPKALPQHYLTHPKASDSFVYVATIQRMAINLFGRGAVFGGAEGESIDEDADKLDIPIHAFDVVIADECHRGYTSQELSTWRNTLEHFDGIKIGLTATPAGHTAAYFTEKVFQYSYVEAVAAGHLVDYDVVNIKSNVRMNGVFLKAGENVEAVDPTTGLTQLDLLEDERAFDATELEKKVTAPDSNRKILLEVKRHADEHEKAYGRFPKTLVFAVNDQPHTSHADQLVNMAREIFARGDAFVEKITGKVDRPLQRIREFRNRPKPGIAVTVDLLSTGVDIPDLEFIVLLRPVKSRILFTQILGRGTRKGEHHTDKDHFTVFDCFDGTLLKYFRESTDITSEEPASPSRTIEELVKAIWDNVDRDYNVGCLVKRLQRIDKAMSGEAREKFEAIIPNGDLAAYAKGLRTALAHDFTKEMTLLKDPAFLDLLVNYPRPGRSFIKATAAVDDVSSERLFRGPNGEQVKPVDYLKAFSKWVAENESKVQAIQVLLKKPEGWTAAALTELRQKLKTSRTFSEGELQDAHRLTYKKELVDTISMVKHAAKEDAPLFNAAERVERAFIRISALGPFSEKEQAWLDRIREVMRENLSIDPEDFEDQAALSDRGGLLAARKTFGEERLKRLLGQLNEGIAA